MLRLVQSLVGFGQALEAKVYLTRVGFTLGTEVLKVESQDSSLIHRMSLEERRMGLLSELCGLWLP